MRRSQHGVALLIVLWACTLLAILLGAPEHLAAGGWCSAGTVGVGVASQAVGDICLRADGLVLRFFAEIVAAGSRYERGAAIDLQARQVKQTLPHGAGL